MKKPNIIIGKKQIILAGMTLVLGTAIYINYAFAASGKIKETGKISTQSANYGDAQLVNADGTEDYFAQARIDKTTSRDEAVQTLQTVMGGGDISENEAVVNALAAVELSHMTELENKMESLIKAQGYKDCIVYLDENDARVVVQSDGLDTAKAASIKDIVLSESKVSAQNIRIFEVK